MASNIVASNLFLFLYGDYIIKLFIRKIKSSQFM